MAEHCVVFFDFRCWMVSQIFEIAGKYAAVTSEMGTGMFAAGAEQIIEGRSRAVRLDRHRAGRRTPGWGLDSKVSGPS